MSDKPAVTPEKTDTNKEQGIGSYALDLLKSGYEKVKSYVAPETATSQALEQKGSLPKLDLVENKDGGKGESKPDKGEAKPEKTEKAEAQGIKDGVDPRGGPMGIMNDRAASQEDKLKAANEMAAIGVKKFVGEDGQKYEISQEQVGNKTLVSIHTDSPSHAVLRGTIGPDGQVHKQHDEAGKEVPYASKWASEHLKDSPILGGKEKTEAADKTKAVPDAAAEKAPSGDEFLKKHPDLKLSHADEVKLQKEHDKQAKENDENSKLLKEKLKSLADDSQKLEKDLADHNVKGFKTRDEMIAQLRKVEPEEVRAGLAKRIDALVHDNQAVHGLERKVHSGERHLHTVEEKLKFADDLKAIDKLPPEQRKVVYDSLEKILDKGDKTQTTDLSALERQRIARDVVHQIAHPEDIKQGNKNTCALASSEYVLAKDHPDVYAKAVADLSTKGELNTVEPGKGIKISPDQIHNDDGNPERTLASKVFQTGAANLALAESGARYENSKPGDSKPLSSGSTPVDDTGERMITKDGKVYDWPGLYAKEQVDVLNKLTGDHYKADKVYAKGADDLQKKLETEASQHGYPIKISFLLPDNSGHAVTITGIDKSTTPATVTYEDPAQPRGKPQQMPMDKLYHTALKGEGVYAAGGKKIQILMAKSPDSDEPPDPYIEIIHR